jgi:pyrimidine deaminase RibD-like protein
VVVKDRRILATAHRGEIPQCHAEFIALEKKLTDVGAAGRDGLYDPRTLAAKVVRSFQRE